MSHHISSSSLNMKEEFPFWITRTSHDQKVAAHGHDFVELVYVARGEGRHIFEGDEYTIRPGDVFIINPGETHSYSLEPGQQIEIINCLFMPSFIPDTLLRELEISSSMDYFYVHPFLGNEDRFNHRLNLHGQDAAAVQALLDHMIKEIGNRGTGYSTIIKLQLIELLILLSRYYSLIAKKRVSPGKNDRELTARRIYGYLERNYDQKITLTSLGELFNISVRQLNRVIKQEYDKSVIDLLHEIRIERAKHLLADTDMKVIVIATVVGYEDPAFFSRLFLRHVGCSPSKYRTGLELDL